MTATARKKKPAKREPVKAGRVFACDLCPKDAEGYAGYEALRGKDFLTHLAGQHDIPEKVAKKTAMRMTMHLSANVNRSYHSLHLPDGTAVGHSMSWCPGREW